MFWDLMKDIRSKLSAEDTKNSQYQILKKQISMDEKKKHLKIIRHRERTANSVRCTESRAQQI